MDAYGLAAVIGSLVVLLGVVWGLVAWAHGLGASSRDGELLVARAERDSARAESTARREAAGDGASAAAGLVKAAALGSGAPAGPDGDLLLLGGPDTSAPGSGAPPPSPGVA